MSADSFEEGGVPPFMYGTHYSTPGWVKGYNLAGPERGASACSHMCHVLNQMPASTRLNETAQLHISLAALCSYVMYWLLRAAPSHMLRLQNGRFDAPDRLFASIQVRSSAPGGG